MIKVLQVLMPVIVMMAIGVFCRKMKFLNRTSVDGLKFLTTKIILPVAIFNALATAKYSASSFLMIGIMLVMLIVSFALGFAMKPLMGNPYKKYLPFMVSVYEGGMMGYPLYSNLVGSENLSNIALLDIAGLLFGFSIYMSMLTQTESGQKLSARKLWTDAVKNPSFIATVLGLIFGLTGLVARLEACSAGKVYDAVINIVTAPMSAIILIVVGFEIAPAKEMIKPCLKTILLRALLQALMIFGVLTVTHLLVGQNKLMDIAIISYMSSPATFSMQSFLKTKEGNAYASTTNSLYCFISIATYAVMAFIYL